MTRSELLQIAKPILFSTDMVRAILDRRKTATRRCVKFLSGKNPNWTGYVKDGLMLYNGRNEPCCRKPPYRRDDILYVRETFRPLSNHPKAGVEYAADWSPKYFENSRDPKSCNGGKWKPSLHMPKKAARIFLKVTDVRIERLQDIDDSGIIAEGLEVGSYFDELWNSTIKKSERDRYGWDTNPWVWVIEFERIYPNDFVKGATNDRTGSN